MIDIKHPKCLCNKSQANFNYPNESKALYCSSCKLEGMIDICTKNHDYLPMGHLFNYRFVSYLYYYSLLQKNMLFDKKNKRIIFLDFVHCAQMCKIVFIF
jgi:hypothetical protein